MKNVGPLFRYRRAPYERSTEKQVRQSAETSGTVATATGTVWQIPCRPGEGAREGATSQGKGRRGEEAQRGSRSTKASSNTKSSIWCRPEDRAVRILQSRAVREGIQVQVLPRCQRWAEGRKEELV